jgi:hypothetical protein
LGALFKNDGPAAGNSSLPLANYGIAHFSPLTFGHSTCVCLKIQVRLAGAIFADNFIEAAISRDFQEVGDKLYCTCEGSIPLTYSPLLPITSGPIVSGNVESSRKEVIRSLEHRLLRF